MVTEIDGIRLREAPRIYWRGNRRCRWNVSETSWQIWLEKGLMYGEYFYEFIYKSLAYPRPLFPDVDTMADMITKKVFHKRKPDPPTNFIEPPALKLPFFSPAS